MDFRGNSKRKIGEPERCATTVLALINQRMDRLMTSSNLTAARARELLSYDPETGFVTWRTSYRSMRTGERAGTPHVAGYWRIGVAGEKHLLHRVAWLLSTGDWPKGKIDHINGVTTDNRLSNLRDVSHAVNIQNQRTAQRAKQSGMPLGVGRLKRDLKAPFYASICHMGKRTNLGYFSTADAAHAAYLVAKRRLHPGCTI